MTTILYIILILPIRCLCGLLYTALAIVLTGRDTEDFEEHYSDFNRGWDYVGEVVDPLLFGVWLLWGGDESRLV